MLISEEKQREIATAFQKLQISPIALEVHYGKPLNEFTDDDLINLRSIHNALRDRRLHESAIEIFELYNPKCAKEPEEVLF